MGIKRIPVDTLADEIHEPVVLEGEATELLPSDRIYLNEKGEVIDPRQDAKLIDLKGRELELPDTTYF